MWILQLCSGSYGDNGRNPKLEAEGFRVLFPGCVGQLTPPSFTLFICEEKMFSIA